LRGLLIGRFQPFHKGHLKIIKKILSEVDELLIVVGSSQHQNTLENPYSADERMTMITRALRSEGLKKFKVYRVPDINDDELYPGHVSTFVPSYDVVYSGNNLVCRLFKSSGKQVEMIKHIRRGFS
jgi:nicotinamide-nucleotide adenylyltransferase